MHPKKARVGVYLSMLIVLISLMFGIGDAVDTQISEFAVWPFLISVMLFFFFSFISKCPQCKKRSNQFPNAPRRHMYVKLSCKQCGCQHG